MFKRSAVLLFCVLLSGMSAYALPRLEAVRLGQQGLGYFRYKGTTTEFIPRGNNYIRLASYKCGGNTGGYHSTFQPPNYDSAGAESSLSYMQSYGYNVVRVFIDQGSWQRATCGNNGIAGNYNGTGMDTAYLDNVADFIRRADSHAIYVIPVLDDYPVDQHYDNIRNQNGCSNMTWPNAYYMCSGYINAKVQYLTDFINAMKIRVNSSQMSAIMAYSLANELEYSSAYPPFDVANYYTVIYPADGGMYSMSDLASRQQAADANMVYWGSTCTNAVKSVDPDAMTTVGFFTYNAVGKSGPNGLSPSYSYATGGNHPRFPGRPWSLTTYSNVNFADIHLYPLGGSYSMTSDLGSIEWSTTYGPILMGEYGAYKSVYANSTSAAYAMRDTQVQSCSSFNFKGWLFWTYDTIEQPTLYNLMENYGAINGLLAPIVRPNPCSP